VRITSLAFALAFVTGCSCASPSPTADAGVGPDAAVVDDAAAPTLDANADAFTCAEPTAGSMAFTGSCGAQSSGGFTTQVAILLRPGGGVRMRVTGRIPGGRTACDRWDSIDVMHGGTMIATLPANGAVVSTLDDGFAAWAEGDVDPSVAALCGASGEMDRFDGYRLVVHARTDGGSLTLTCGNGGTGFPPSVVMTCHQGVDPPVPDTVFHHTTTGDRTALQAWFAHGGPAVVSIDPHVRFLRGAAPFSPTLAPVDTTGWSFLAWSTQPGGPGGSQDIFLAETMGSPLGTDCPMSPVMPTDHAPVLIGRVSGMTTAGPFATDLYAELCFSSSM
jgi:hypothetical protein